MRSTRPYEVFEDSRAVNYKAEPTEAQRFIMGEGRDFRAYLDMRLEEAKQAGRIPGVKIGSAYWLGDPDPASLPVTIVKVDRPLEDSIRSDWRYQLRESSGICSDRQDQDSWQILRAAQMAGYWQAKERLCEMIEPVVRVPYAELIRTPRFWVGRLAHYCNQAATDAQATAAVNFVNPELRNV